MSIYDLPDIDFYLITPILSIDMDEDEEHGEGGVSTITRKKVKRPSRYKVLLHNDDYTTMEFVIYVLQKHFGKTSTEAHDVMLKVHNHGVGICGVYTYEIAESKVAKVTKDAQTNGHPLLCTSEPE